MGIPQGGTLDIMVVTIYPTMLKPDYIDPFRLIKLVSDGRHEILIRSMPMITLILHDKIWPRKENSQYTRCFNAGAR